MKFDKKGQVTVFVIAAIVIVGIIILFFVFRDRLFGEIIPAEFRPVYDLYNECIESEMINGISILGTQGGRIETGLYVPGSDFAPFSSHLNFLGISVPYWYSFRANNIISENVPSKNDMEEELATFLSENINNCDFSAFYSQGFYVELGDPTVSIKIEDGKVIAGINAEVIASRDGETARKVNHDVSVDSKIGEFYDIAKEIYNKEKNERFLEEYVVDVLRLHAPVDGVEVQCGPVIWKSNEVAEAIRKGLQENIASLKFEGNYYQINDQKDNYFVINHRVDEPVNLLYFEDWPSKIEISPASQSLMIAEPVGNQEGLGILGFCYAPYHFVYDLSFPVIIQITNGFENFQFPLVVSIENNFPSNADFLNVTESDDVDVCLYKENPIEIKTYDVNLNPVPADISYKCFDSVCNIGKSEIANDGTATLEEMAPACLNGVLIARADGFFEKKKLFSSNSENYADIILDKEYLINLSLKLGGNNFEKGFAVIQFVGDDGYSQTASLPGYSEIKLKEGSYNISVTAYGNSSIVIPGTMKTQCVEVARGGLFGLFGSTKEECYNTEVPEIRIDSALVGGGKTSTYILVDELEKGNLVLQAGELPKPFTMEQLQYNYAAFESLGVSLDFYD